jgi:hypothetical protein
MTTENTEHDELNKFIQMDQRRKKRSASKYFLDLQKSKGIVAQIAGQIYAAYIQANKITDANKDEMIQKAVDEAAKIADTADRLVKDKEEGPADSSLPL